LKDRDHLNGQTDIQSYEVSQAFANHEIQMFFQPKVDIKDNNRLVGAEALVRWIHPEKGLLTPKDFVDLLESSPYRLTFINSVVEQSAHFCETMKQSGLPISVSFNLSANDLQDLRVTYELSQVQEKYGFSAGELQIELSEQETDVSLDNLKRSLDAVKELGYSIALDDFGTGMSSLAYFQNLPADTIKLDRAFIKDIHLNPSSEHLTKMVVYLSKAEGLTVVAEGVENASEADRLLKLGVDQVQGFLFGKPMPATEFLQYYGLELVEDDV
jgi:EAL domain-containing protein (putative c-di-GMP-specific phosphodiesterase class I)